MESVVHGIRVDYSRDKLFDALGLMRLKESYMKDEEQSHKNDLHLYQNNSVRMQNMRRDYMNTAVSIGCLILLPFFLLVVASVACLYHVFLTILKIQRRD